MIQRKYIKTLTLLSVHIIICLLSVNTMNAQISYGGQPYSFSDTNFANPKLRSTPINRLQIQDLDMNIVNKELESLNECKECNSGFYYGKEVDVNVNFFQRATRYDYSDDEYVWILEFKSEEAKGYQFIFDKFDIADGGRLFIYNEGRDMLLGAFTSANKRDDLRFLTQYINGNNVYLEYIQPKNNDGLDSISIEEVVYIFTDNFFVTRDNFSSSKPVACHINTSCPEGNGHDVEIKSTVLILLKKGGDFWSTCSGVLINDGENYKKRNRPYLLSANHCYDNSMNVTDWIFVFRHELAQCGLDQSTAHLSIGKSATGADIIFRDTGSKVNDLLILQLKNKVSEVSKFDIAFAGYDFDPKSKTYGGLNDPIKYFVNIHHPKGDTKKISIKEGQITSVGFNSTGDKVDRAADTHWEVLPNIGFSTEAGSSGSALFDSEKRVIGILHKGDENYKCDGSNITRTNSYFGKLSKIWGQVNNFYSYFPFGASKPFVPEASYCEAGSFEFGITNPQPKYAPGSIISVAEYAIVYNSTASYTSSEVNVNPYPKSHFFDPYCGNSLQPIYAGVGRRIWSINGQATSEVFNTIKKYSGIYGDTGPVQTYYEPQNKEIRLEKPGVYDINVTLNLANYFQKDGIRACFPIPDHGLNYRFGLISNSISDSYGGSVRVIVADCYGRRIVNNPDSKFFSIASSDEKEIGAGYIDVDNVKFETAGKYGVEAYQRVTLKAGTMISAGVTFSAKIVPCPAVATATNMRSTPAKTYNNKVEEDLTLENKVVVFPNPTDGIVSIRIEDGLSIRGVEVYDMNGRLVIKPSDIINPYAFYLDNLADGMYLLKVHTNKGVSNHKVVKKR